MVLVVRPICEEALASSHFERFFALGRGTFTCARHHVHSFWAIQSYMFRRVMDLTRWRPGDGRSTDR
jgi:elongation factor P hydroxylase